MLSQDPFSHARHFLYLLQLENFHLRRFWRASWQALFNVPTQTKKNIVWTKKLSLVTTLALGLNVGFTYLVVRALPASYSGLEVISVAVLMFVLLLYVLFVALALATLVIRPFDRFVRFVLISRAKRHLKKLSDVTVLGITGSYGKTTMKRTITTMLSPAINVVASQKSHNTPVAIARMLLKEVSNETDLVIIEMGAHQEGDIAELCSIAKPDISILNGINEAHLERFGSLENTTRGKFEIARHAKQDALVLLNADDQRVMDNFENHVGNRRVQFYSSENDKRADFVAENIEFHSDGSGISFTLRAKDEASGEEKIGYVKVTHLAPYIIGNVMAGCLVARELEVDISKLKRGISQIKPVEHRLQPSKRSLDNVLVIDDTYNGNPAGAKMALQILDKFNDRRKVYVTPGLVEMGERTEVVHETLGKQIAEVADVVVLYNNSVLEYLKEGLRKAGFDGKVLVIRKGETLEGQLAAITRPHDVVMLQNDWPENYL